MSSIRLRPWQRSALDKFKVGEQPDFMAVATPGAGKTTFALAAARHVLSEHKCRLIVVAPTAHLKWQWTEAAERFGLRLDAEWNANQGGVPKDMHGIVTTYQQVTSSADAATRRRGARPCCTRSNRPDNGCFCRAHPSAATRPRFRS
jgi:superfamily II DNA or RNA helicase